MPPSEPSDASDPRQNRKTRLKRAIKWTIAGMVVIGLYFAIDASLQQWREQRDTVAAQVESIDRQLAQNDLTPEEHRALVAERERLEKSIPTLGNFRWPLIVSAAFLYVLGLVPNGFLLHNALGALGQSPRLATSVSAQLIGHVGKYVPGKAMVIVLRAGLLSRDGVPLLPATVCIFLETFMMMAVGATMAAAIVIWLPVPRWIAFMSIAIAVLASVPTFPPVLRIAAARVTRSRGLSHDLRIGFRLFGFGWLWSLLAWSLIGGSFTLLILAIPSATPLPSIGMIYAIATAAMSLAVVVGFASLLPGGAGIRELVLTTILAVAIGPIHGLLAAIVARVVYLVAEVTAAGICWLFVKRDASESPESPRSLASDETGETV